MITDAQALAARKLVGPKLKKAGLPLDLTEFNPSYALRTKTEAHNLRKDVIKIARELIDGFEKAADEDRQKELERAHDGMMGLIDRIDSRLDELTPNPMRPGANDRIECRGQDGVPGDAEEAVAVGLTREQRMADWARERSNVADEYRGLSLGGYFRAMTLGAKTDAERRALSEGTDSAGGYTVPDILSAQLIDLLRARTVAITAGARTIPLTSDTNYIAKVAADPTPAWRAEAATIAESDPTFGRVTLTPRSLAVIVKVSRELLEDSLNLQTELPRVIAAAMAVELDRVAFFGTGTAPQPRGIVNTTGVNTIAHNAALSDFSPLVSARTKVLEANAAGVTAFVMSPRDEGNLANLKDSTAQPLRQPKAIEDMPFLTSTSFPTNGGVGLNESTIVTGHFPHLLIGIRNNIRVEILRERYADTHQYGFVAHMRADVAVEHGAAFTTVTGVQS